MARLTSDLVLTLHDKVSGAAKRIDLSLDQLERRQSVMAHGMARGTGATAKATSALGLYAREAAMAAAPVAAGFAAVDIMKTSAAFETSLTNIAKKGGLAADGVARVKNEILDMVESGKVAMAPAEIAAAYERGIAAGIPLDKMREFTMLSAQAADAWDMTGADVGNAFAGFNTTMQVPFEEMRRYADLINSLADSGISDEKDIVSFLDRVGSQLKTFGLAKEEIAAIGATLLNLKMPADVAARMMDTLQSKLLNPKGTDASTAAFADLYGSAEAFTELLKKDSKGALVDFLKRIGELDKFKRSEILTDIFGQGFSGEISTVAAAIAEVERNLALAADPSKFVGSLGASYDKKLATMESKWKVFTANLEKLKIDLGDLVIAPGGDFLGDATGALTEFSDAIQAAKDTYDTIRKAVTGREATGDFSPYTVRGGIESDAMAREGMATLAGDGKKPIGAVGAFGARDDEGVTKALMDVAIRNAGERWRRETPKELSEEKEFIEKQQPVEQYDPGSTQSYRQWLQEKHERERMKAALIDQPAPSNDLGRTTGVPARPSARPDRAAAARPSAAEEIAGLPADTRRSAAADIAGIRPRSAPVAPPPVSPAAPSPVKVGLSLDEAAVRDIDQQLGALFDKKQQVMDGFKISGSPEAAATLRAIGDEMDRLIAKRSQLELGAYANTPVVTSTAFPPPAPDIAGPVAAEGEKARVKAVEVGGQIQSALSVTAKPIIDSSGVDSLISKVDVAAGKLRALGAQAAQVSRSAGAAVAAGAAASRVDFDGLHADTTHPGF